MNRLSYGLRRAGGTAAGAAVLLGAFLGMAPSAGASVKPAPAAVVATALGANNIPAALVILVDISASMSPPNGVYPQVYRQLPKFLAALHKQDPQDQVSVVQFADKADTQVVYNWGPPQDFQPAPNPHFAVGTDIGYAFKVALDQFGSAPNNPQVDGVLLLSDGGMWAPGDPTYDGGAGYRAPGWAQLRQRVQGQPITGYGLPLTNSATLTGKLNTALNQGFGSQSVMLSANYSNLSGEMGAAQQKILDSRVAAAVAPDSGIGVQVAWSGPGVANGVVHLNLAAGSADPTLTLTANTSRVPLDVQNLRASFPGFPEAISAEAARDIELRPGHPVSVPLQVSWKPMTASTQTWTGNITLTATVGSPYSNAIRNYFQDRSFTTGDLAAVNVSYQASPPPPLNVLLVLLIILVLVAALVVALGFLVLRTRLSGKLTFTPVVGTPATVNLPRLWPWYVFDTGDLGVQQGRVIVRRSVKTGEMRLTSTRHRRNPVTLKNNGSTTIAGIRVQHSAELQREFAGR
jgi:hypothetical protein